jgi:hypothetical protein
MIPNSSILGGDIATDCAPEWHRLDDISKKVWLSHAREKLRVLIEFFRPRIVILSYSDQYRAHLSTFDKDDNGHEHGLVFIFKEAEASR